MDKRVKKLIKNSTKKNHRALFVLLGHNCCKQIIEILKLLTTKLEETKVLWCSNNCDYSQKTFLPKLHELFTATGEYSDQHKSYKFLSYRDAENSCKQFNLAVFEDCNVEVMQSLPWILYSVNGGGAAIFFYPNLHNKEDLQDYLKSSRFGQRFFCFLSSNAVVLDDDSNVLAFSKKISLQTNDEGTSSDKEKIQAIVESNANDSTICTLIGLCETAEQAEFVVKLIDILKKRKPHSSVSVSSALRRGKSAALGFAIAASLCLNYSNIYISSSSQDDVSVIFKFILLGLDAMEYKEDKDYDLIQAVSPKLNNALVGINIFKDHPQSVRFIMPQDIGNKIQQAELVVIDEAAAMPLEILKSLTGPYVTLMASSVGLGVASPHLYNNMVNALHPALTPSAALALADTFHKEIITQPIMYASGDPVETCMNELFCAHSVPSSFSSSGYPEPDQCGLLYVNRDVFTNKSNNAENYVQSLCSILSSSARSMDVDFIMKLADSPNHHIFCLHCAHGSSKETIICAIVVHIDTNVPDNIVHFGSNIRSNVPLCFNEWMSSTADSSYFTSTEGAHVIHFVTHPSYRRMGYGSRAFRLLQDFYEGKCISLDEPHQTIGFSELKQNENLDFHILLNLTDVHPDPIQYFNVSFTLNSQNFRFWKKLGYVPVFSSKLNSEIEHSLFMMKSVDKDFEVSLQKNCKNFRNYFCCLLNSELRKMPSPLALNLLSSYILEESKCELTKEKIDILIKPSQMKCLEKFSRNLLDFHSIIHIIPTLTNMYFDRSFKDISLPRLQEVIMLSLGLQFKSIDDISKELGLPSAQVNGLLNRTIRKLTKHLSDIIEKHVEKSLSRSSNVVMEPLTQDLDEELEEAAKKIQEKQEMDAKLLQELDVSQYAIKGSEDDWERALLSGRKTLVSIKSIRNTSKVEENATSHQNFKKHKNKPMKRKK